MRNDGGQSRSDGPALGRTRTGIHMCGRYASSASPDDLIEEFEVVVDATGERTRSLLATPQNPPVGAADYNMAPTKQAPVVLTRERDGQNVRQLRFLTWGLIPSWAKDASVGARMINARAETLLEKPSFAKAATARRCIVPAHGWYEWQVSPVATNAQGKPRKQPFFMHRTDGASCALAGVYEFWRDRHAVDENQAWVASFAIVTTSAGPGLDRIHDRQPLVLQPHQFADWLDPQLTDASDVAPFLQAGDSSGIEAYPISTAVSAVANNGPGLLSPLPADQLVGVVDPMTGEVLGHSGELQLDPLAGAR